MDKKTPILSKNLLFVETFKFKKGWVRSLSAKYKSLIPFQIKLLEFEVRRWEWEKAGNIGRLFFAL